MSTTTRLARVIGLTRSFSLPGGSRIEADPVTDGEADPVAEALKAEATATNPEAAFEAVETAAIARVTTVEAEPAAERVSPVIAEAIAAPAASTDTRAQGAGLFDEIEADMASLLATLDTVGSDRRPAAASETSDEDEAAGSDEDARSFALLSELNRLWAGESSQSAN